MENILTKNLHGTLTIGTPKVYSYRQFYDIIRRKFHIKVLLVPVPFFIPLLAIRIINLLHLPIGFTEDNLQGLKKLKAFDTETDLKKVGVALDPLEKILDKIGTI